MDLADGTFITADTAHTRVRGGGFGSRAWLARISGPDPTFGFAREFVQPDRSRLSGSARSGTISWAIPGPGLYEWRGFCVGSTPRNWESSGFCLIAEDGTVTQITKDQAQAVAAGSARGTA